MKVADLEGAALDHAVARALGWEWDDALLGWMRRREVNDWVSDQWFKPSTDWSVGGPIIEREGIRLDYRGHREWSASVMVDDGPWLEGPTPLVAAMRALVAAKLGEDAPD